MKQGEIVLLRLPQPNLSPGKLRPALVLSELSGLFGDVLVCGILSQLHQEIPNWDERLTPAGADFGTCGLKVVSVIRIEVGTRPLFDSLVVDEESLPCQCHISQKSADLADRPH
jgi:PemK-like, MazF-like toxin of type II toxin-antitoxin system